MSQRKGCIRVVESVLHNNQAFRPAVLIPVYDHEKAIIHTLAEVLKYDCPVLLVDDGSGETCQKVLNTLCSDHSDRVSLVRLNRNSGKGAALNAGFRTLQADGFSHAIQIDADGQHEISDLPKFLEASINNPDCLVTGQPQFDDDMPRIRFYFRYLTHILVWINTLSFAIRDTMCGFRIYPLEAITRMLDQDKCGDRMDFDTEVMVRWFWQGGSIRNIPTRVNYPIDGISHFQMGKDNLFLTLMHSKLFFGMLRRLPVILWRRLNG